MSLSISKDKAIKTGKQFFWREVNLLLDEDKILVIH